MDSLGQSNKVGQMLSDNNGIGRFRVLGHDLFGKGNFVKMGSDIWMKMWRKGSWIYIGKCRRVSDIFVVE